MVSFCAPSFRVLRVGSVQAAAGDQLHHVVMQAVLLADVEDGHDVGVVQPGRRLRLAAEPRPQLLVGEQVRRQHLDGDAAAQGFVLGLVDHAHPAAADLADEAILAEPLRERAERSAAKERSAAPRVAA